MVEEKRFFPRQFQSEIVHVDILKASNEKIETSIRYEGAMKDISPHGIRLHGKHKLEKDALLEIIVEFETDHSKFSLSGNVKWVTVTTENEYVAGLELNESGSLDLASWKEKF